MRSVRWALVALFLLAGTPASAQVPTVPPVPRVHIDYACHVPRLHLCSLQAMLAERAAAKVAPRPSVRPVCYTPTPVTCAAESRQDERSAPLWYLRQEHRDLHRLHRRMHRDGIRHPWYRARNADLHRRLGL